MISLGWDSELESLKKSDLLRAKILSAISELVVYQNTQQQIIWANKAAAESVGKTIDELSGEYCYEVWYGRSQPCEDCPIVKVLETGTPQKAELASPDGRFWLVRGYPVREKDQRLLGVVEVALEITQRKLAEKALQESE